MSLAVKYATNLHGLTLSPKSLSVIEYICKQANITSVLITSLSRTPEEQGSSMFYDMQAGTGVVYGKAGTQVQNIYTNYKKDNDIPAKTPLSDPDSVSYVKNAMITKVANTNPPSYISNHCGDASKLQAIDIAPSSIGNKGEKFAIECNKAWKELNLLRKLIVPKAYESICSSAGDRAFHLEVVQTGPNTPTVPSDANGVSSPTKRYNMASNTTLYKSANWIQSLSKDFTDASSASPHKI